MRRLFIIVGICSALGTASAVQPGDVEARLIHERLYKKAEHDISFGDAEQRLNAAIFLGARKNTLYVRLLGRELLRELDHKDPYINLPRNSPAVKAYMAWALGRIGHPKGVPFLIRALEVVGRNMAEDKRQVEIEKKAEDERYRKEGETKPNRGITNDDPIRRIVLEKRRPGPYLQSKKHALPYSPDVYWSLSNEFRDMMAPDLTSSTVRVRFMGFNWVNTAFYIFDAIGDTYLDTLHREGIDAKHVDAVAAYLGPDNYNFIRGAAAICLGKIGNSRAIRALEEAYGKEKSEEVKAKIAHAVLKSDKTMAKYYVDLLKYLEDDRDSVRYPAAVAFRDLKMGEAIVALREARKVESVASIREILDEAIDHARIDSLRLPE